MVMSALKRYRDISPVTLQVVGGAVRAGLYCGEVEGLSGGLVESFLVEIFRCKLCQFTCGLKAAISSHMLLRHRPPGLAYLERAGGEGVAVGGEEAGFKQEASPYRLDLNGESKRSDEDEEFLLYNMLDDMSPPPCDISGEAGLQVAHTCEVSTLFEEDSSIFPLKGDSVDLSCPMDPPSSQEEMAQSAHLMTLGLCRISASKPPPASRPAHLPPDVSPRLPLPGGLKQSETSAQETGTPPPGLQCLLCPLVLPSRRLLDVHVRSHRTDGGFNCVRCGWRGDSWEEVEPHWRSCCRRRREEEKKKRKKKKKKKKKAAESRTFSLTSQRVQPQDGSGGWSGKLIGPDGQKGAGGSDRQTSRSQTGPMQSVQEKKKNRRHKEEEEGESGFCCSLCLRKFSTKLTLRRHLGVHRGDKPFSCPHCPYSSRLKASLLQHLRTHTGEKPFRCAQCSYASIDRSSLLRHSRTHSQEKPYRCPHCDYSSIQKKSLDLHSRRHHTGEAFPCQQCEYSSPDRQLLLRHVRRHHAPSQHAPL